ncbi:hypothetical protein BN14_07497 [Rhizoctonia solani AG-1 IB]|uniref:Uncharacterized protein n=1 Tax=Thanatephorus cucumeris (strain AG1-IB / isolate 7/3/14) TaxID=1108050 RepID=M5CC46_THACB|nr:hypothetical protein BN14_07497 [Rhizoctonia solani AG-1 IB]
MADAKSQKPSLALLGSRQGSPRVSAASLESTSYALKTCTQAEYRPDFLWQCKDTSKLDQLHKHLIGKDSSRSQPSAPHQLLEKKTTHLINHLDHWKESMLQEITQAVENTIQRLIPSSAALEPHTTSRKMLITVEDTPRAVSGLSSSGNRDFLVPVKTGDKTEGKEKKTLKLESLEPSRMWKVLHIVLFLLDPLKLLFLGLQNVQSLPESQSALPVPSKM